MDQVMQERCESAFNLLLNDLRHRTDEYYQCMTQLDVQQQLVLTVSSLSLCLHQPHTSSN